MDELRSIASEERAYVRFINTTNEVVEIIWINFDGDCVVYELLNGGCHTDIDTYKYHPWIARNSATKDRLHLDKQFVYNPKTSKEYFEERFPDKQSAPAEFEVRICVNITSPSYSLRSRILLRFRNMFQKKVIEIDKSIGYK